MSRLELRLGGLEGELRRCSRDAWSLAALHGARASGRAVPEWVKADLSDETWLDRPQHDVGAQYLALCREIVDLRLRARDLAFEIERARIVLNATTGAGGGGGVRDPAVRSELRRVLLTRANLVFATLSQCGSFAMSEVAPVRVKFRTVVVDEAAQAVETATLIPLCLGAHRCVMVGDPAQLPATVLSMRAKEARFETSLFERLMRGGHPVHLLDVQYRSRPEIARFSSARFYGGRLLDGPNVRDPAYALGLFASKPRLGPLVFYDVLFGAEVRSAGDLSLSNDAEAFVAVELVCSLRLGLAPEQCASPVTGRRCTLAVLCAYRAQVDAVRRRLAEVRPHLPLGEPDFVTVDTVDGVQGKEFDVVVLSCVRASGGSRGIGFLDDARRLNVSATRARFALLVVGNAQRLCAGSVLWAWLTAHVRERGKWITIAARVASRRGSVAQLAPAAAAAGAR